MGWSHILDPRQRISKFQKVLLTLHCLSATFAFETPGTNAAKADGAFVSGVSGNEVSRNVKEYLERQPPGPQCQDGLELKVS